MTEKVLKINVSGAPGDYRATVEGENVPVGRGVSQAEAIGDLLYHFGDVLLGQEIKFSMDNSGIFWSYAKHRDAAKKDKAAHAT